MRRAEAWFDPALLRNRLLLPEGAEVLDAFVDPRTRNVVFVVTHPSFPEVPDGLVAKAISCSIEWK